MTGVPAGLALSFKSDSNNGHWALFAIDTTSLQDLELSFSTMRNNHGFNSDQVAYSTDGGQTFTNFGSPYNPPTSFGAPGSLQNFDFSAIPELDNNPKVQIRITFNGATNNGGNNRIDNVLFEAAN